MELGSSNAQETRNGCTIPPVFEVKKEMSAYMSHPKETAKLVEEAATSAHVNQ
jgi:hypothetical protein